MRLAGQFKCGFYPAPPAALAMIAKRLRAPEGKPFRIIDPCAGEGLALRQLGDALALPPALRYAVELDEGRAVKVRDNNPGANVLAPASTFGVSMPYGAMSFLYLNPPFDDELGGGQRTEAMFLQKCTPWLRTGGVLCLVCPRNVVAGTYDRFATDTAEHLMSRYERIGMLEFPPDVRKYNEVVILAVKRKEPVKTDRLRWEDLEAPQRFIYDIPNSGDRPIDFIKTEHTEMELRRMLAASPLRRMLETTKEKPLARPLMPVNDGHRAMLLAAGHLDGVVQPEKEPAHVVRGTAQKEQYIASEEETEGEDGAVNTKTVYAERVKLVVRVINAKGELHTLKNDTEGEVVNAE